MNMNMNLNFKKIQWQIKKFKRKKFKNKKKTEVCLSHHIDEVLKIQYNIIYI